jgi:hypothetical protein
MAVLRINANQLFTVDVSVRESDIYSDGVYVNINRNYTGEGHLSSGASNFAVTPSQLDQLGRFLIKQAQEIATAQEVRRRDASIRA